MELIHTVEKLRKELKNNQDFECNPIDMSLPVIGPFRGNDEIKLIILGQDPTIKNVNSRKKISCTLNLDKNNALKTYVIRICDGLGISIENVYATNLFKYFYTERPSKTIDVLKTHLEPNLHLLQQELTEFRNIPVITLGETVLQLITNEKAKVRVFWGYNAKTKITNGQFTFSKANDNKLSRDLFPFPHQPSIRKKFYADTLINYLEYAQRIIKSETYANNKKNGRQL